MIRPFVALLVTALIAAPSPVAAEPSSERTGAAPASDSMAFVRGAQKWGNTCARCHSMRDAKEFNDAQWQVIVAHMRARAGLTAEDASDILRFLQESTDMNPLLSRHVLPALLLVSSAASAAGPNGSALFRQTCVACHGADGKGAIPGVPDLTRKDGPLAVKSDAQLIESILKGFQSKGSPMAMPPKGGNPQLTPEDAAALVTYLRTLQGK